jgi:hypothetical protein
MHATCPAQFIPLDLITITSGTNYEAEQVHSSINASNVNGAGLNFGRDNNYPSFSSVVSGKRSDSGLTFKTPVVTRCTTRFNIPKLYILPTQCICSVWFSQ